MLLLSGLTMGTTTFDTRAAAQAVADVTGAALMNITVTVTDHQVNASLFMFYLESPPLFTPRIQNVFLHALHRSLINTSGPSVATVITALDFTIGNISVVRAEAAAQAMNAPEPALARRHVRRSLLDNTILLAVQAPVTITGFGNNTALAQEISLQINTQLNSWSLQSTLKAAFGTNGVYLDSIAGDTSIVSAVLQVATAAEDVITATRWGAAIMDAAASGTLSDAFTRRLAFSTTVLRRYTAVLLPKDPSPPRPPSPSPPSPPSPPPPPGPSPPPPPGPSPLPPPSPPLSPPLTSPPWSPGPQPLLLSEPPPPAGVVFVVYAGVSLAGVTLQMFAAVAVRAAFVSATASTLSVSPSSVGITNFSAVGGSSGSRHLAQMRGATALQVNFQVFAASATASSSLSSRITSMGGVSLPLLQSAMSAVSVNVTDVSLTVQPVQSTILPLSVPPQPMQRMETVDDLHGAKLAGVVIGCSFALIFLILLCIIIWQQRRGARQLPIQHGASKISTPMSDAEATVIAEVDTITAGVSHLGRRTSAARRQKSLTDENDRTDQAVRAQALPLRCQKEVEEARLSAKLQVAEATARDAVARAAESALRAQLAEDAIRVAESKARAAQESAEAMRAAAEDYANRLFALELAARRSSRVRQSFMSADEEVHGLE